MVTLSFIVVVILGNRVDYRVYSICDAWYKDLSSAQRQTFGILRMLKTHEISSQRSKDLKLSASAASVLLES